MTAGSIVVPDASVLLKWVLPGKDEADVDIALALRDAIVGERVGCLLPSLWLFEVANTIGRRYPDDAPTMLGGMMALRLQEHRPTDAWVRRGLELARRYEVAFYDASYHATALVCGGTFVTADERYVTKVNGAGAVVRLRDWSA